MALVLDCSVTVAWYFASEASTFTNQLLERVGIEPMVVPALWTLEFVSAIRNAERRRRIGAADRAQILEQAAQLAFEIDSTPVPIIEIDDTAQRFSLTPYDAVYLDLARRRRIPLATLDADLVRAAREAKLPVLTDATLFPEHHVAKRRPQSR